MGQNSLCPVGVILWHSVWWPSSVLPGYELHEDFSTLVIQMVYDLCESHVVTETVSDMYISCPQSLEHHGQQLSNCFNWVSRNFSRVSRGSSSDHVMRIPASRILCHGSNRQIHTDYRNPVEEKGRHGCSLSERGWEGQRQPDPCLDRLLLLFWAHYMEDGPHLLYTGSL